MHNEIVTNQMRRRHFIGDLDGPIVMGDDKTALPRPWRERPSDVERGDLSGNLKVPLGVATEDRRWYEAVTGRMPASLYIVAVCYATVVISLGWLPWNILLILLLLPGRNKHLRFRAFDTMPLNESVRSRLPCRGGSSL
jgi:hypothetical protein